MGVSWSAAMVTPTSEPATAPMFLKQVVLDPGHGTLRSAILHISCLGVFEAAIDGVPLSDEALSPGWSAYEWRLRYRSYQVADRLGGTGGLLSVVVGNGWYRGRLGFAGIRALYGRQLGLIAQMEIIFDDGHRQFVVTDESWVVRNSDILDDDLYDGETVDARRRVGDVDALPPIDIPVCRMDFDVKRLAPYLGPAVTRQRSLDPVRVWTSPSGRTLLDFGQNLVGWLRFTVRGPRGGEIRIRHAEVLEDGELGTRPLRDALATDRLILSGRDDFFEPTFTFHGFRYAEISGWPGELSADSVEAVVVHSTLRRTGHFECSDDLINQLHRNIVWSTRGNFLDLPTDCPQRNERLGWTGDIAVFAATAAFLFDVDGFLADWLVDLAMEQRHAGGRVPFVVPDPLKYAPVPPEFPTPESTAIWADAAVWVPWAHYEAYGDRSVLARQFDSMTAHMRRVEGLLSAESLWDRGFQFGDWLDPDAPPDDPVMAKADPGVVATASLYRSAVLVARVATVLGRNEDAEHFESLARRVRNAFNRHYVDAEGLVTSDCATVYALAIVFDLLDDETEQLAGKRLAQLVEDNGYHISTGFAGTPYLADALTRTGHFDTAYGLLTQTTCPSWLYPVTMGATTIWERWDSMLPDGRINPGEMTSFNHYALGAVADWMHRTIAGLTPLAPGYAKVRIAPRPGGGITWAAGSLLTRHGEIAVRWKITDGLLIVDTTIPEGVQAVLSTADGAETDLRPGRSRTEVPA